MQYSVVICFVFILLSCNQSNQHNGTDSVLSGYSDSRDSFQDFNQEYDRIYHDETNDEYKNEKWFGLDSDDDTVIYEQDGKILTSGYVAGTFERVDRSDFMHFVLRDSNDYLHSFFMNTGNQRQMDKYFEGYEPARGHPVTVKWVRGQLPVGKDGATKTVYQAKEIHE